MKYLLWTISILAALCLGLLIAPLMTPKPKPASGALVVNQRIYQPQELEEVLRATPYHFSSRGELISDLIYRELLLQEAKRLKIDTETEFRRSMRDYFEQSMIKTLIDRRSSAADLQPTPEQVAACKPWLGRRLRVQKRTYSTQESAQIDQTPRIEDFDLPFLELPEDIRSTLAELRQGNLSQVFHSGSDWYRVRILDIADLPPEKLPSASEQTELCKDELRRQAFQQWLEGLYRRAHIELPPARKEGAQ